MKEKLAWRVRLYYKNHRERVVNVCAKNDLKARKKAERLAFRGLPRTRHPAELLYAKTQLICKFWDTD